MGLTLATSNSVFAAERDTYTFTQDDCTSLYRVNFIERLIMAAGFFSLLMVDIKRAPEKRTVLGVMSAFAFVAYEMANTPFRSEKEAYCAKQLPNP